MVDKIRVEIQGEEALYKAFDSMDDGLRKKALRDALRSVGRMWRQEAKNRAPVLSGALRRSITFATKVKNSLYGGVGKLWMGPRYNKGNGTQDPGVYGLFQELGTKHSKPQPFMKPTFEATKDQALKIFGDKLWEHIRKAGK